MSEARVVRLAGREFRVRLQREDDGLVAEVREGNAPPRRVRLEPGGPGRVLVDREPLDYAIRRTARAAFALRAGGAEWRVEVLSEGEAALEAGRSRSAGAPLTLAVRSPMPGRLLAALVADGQDVEEGAGLFIVEAMKMENEIRAPRAGRVAGIAVAEGEAVEQDQVLCRLHVGPPAERLGEPGNGA